MKGYPTLKVLNKYIRQVKSKMQLVKKRPHVQFTWLVELTCEAESKREKINESSKIF